MKDKVVMFKYGDGIKEVRVGDKAWEVPNDHRQGTGRHVTILAIGRKYITVGEKDMKWTHSQFAIDTGWYKSEYGSGYTLYTSKEGQEKARLEREFILDVQKRISGYSVTLTYDQAVRIKAILEER